MARSHPLELTLSAAELEELDEQRGNIPRAVYMRSLIQRPPDVADVASRDEALAILTGLARDGRVSAAIALARELRDDSGGDGGGDLLSKLLSET